MSTAYVVSGRLIAASLLMWLGVAPVLPRLHGPVAPPKVTLQLKEFVADTESYDVNSTLITGPTEAILVDAQYRMTPAGQLADMIAATGKHLKAIVITHPDDDHYYGLEKILQRFPGTPVYMAPGALAQFQSREVPNFARLQDRIHHPPAGAPATLPPWVKEIPDSLITPQALPTSTLTVNGVEIRVVADRQGDVLEPANSYLWIPSQRIVIAGDIVFNQVNVWLAASSPSSRAAWRQTIKDIAALKPLIVVAGHKRSADLPDTPDVLTATSNYLADFDSAKRGASTPEQIVSTMQQKYPGLAVGGILVYAARTAQ